MATVDTSSTQHLQQQQIIIADEDEELGQGIDLRTILNILFGKWYVFVLSILIALIIGSIYVYRTPKVYQQEATVLVKDGKSGSASGAEAFADITGVAGLVSSNVENEQLILQSRSIMEAVVRELGLQYFYYERHFMRRDELYETTPVVVRPARPDQPVAGADFTVRFLPGDSAHFAYVTDDTTFVAPFDEEIDLPGIGPATMHLNRATRDWYVAHHATEVGVVAVDLQSAISIFQRGLSVDLVQKDASLLRLAYVSTSPRKAADILNRIVVEHSRQTIEAKNEVLEHSQDFIDDRLEVISMELDRIDGRVEDFKRKEHTANPIDEARAYFEKADNLDAKIADLEIQLRLVRELRQFMDRHKSDYAILPFNIGINNAALNTQINSYNDLVTRYRRLVAASSANSPVVVDADATLQTMLTTIRQTTADLQRSIEISLAESRQMGDATAARMVSANSNMRELTSIERDQRIKSELYTYLLQKKEENAIMHSMTESNIRPIDAAYGSRRPVAPRTGRILFVLVILAVIGPLAYYFVADMLYTKVRGRSDVTAVVTAPVVGEIPSKPREKAHQEIFVGPGSSNQISESFRILRTNLRFIAAGGQRQVMSVTSTQPGEGKSYVSVNLALTLALAGRRVLLVDLDMRKMATTRLFKMRHQPGLSELLAGTAPLSAAASLIRPSDYDGLSILPGGAIPPNPAELLMSEHFDRLVETLREHYDYVVLDNPPYDVVADTGIANRAADVTLYVVRIGSLDRHALPVIEDLYQAHKLRNMALVLTDVNYEKLAYSMGYSGYGKTYNYGYGYGRGYAYGSGYGYYSDDDGDPAQPGGGDAAAEAPPADPHVADGPAKG